MRIILLMSVLILSACAPYYTTKKPEINFRVTDANGLPIKDATVKFATVVYPYGDLLESESLKTDENGECKVEKDAYWQMVVFTLHGSKSYSWNFCVEKDGYSASAMNDVSSSGIGKLAEIKLTQSEGVTFCKGEHFPARYEVSHNK